MKKPEMPPNVKIPSLTAAETNKFLEQNIFDRLSEIDKEYLYWEEFKYKTKSIGFSVEKLWQVVKRFRNNSKTLIQLVDQKQFTFFYNTPGFIQQKLHEFDLNLGGYTEGGGLIPEEEKERFLISSIMEEAIASSQLEGAVTTREVAKEMLQSGRKPKNISEKMIVNNYLTIKKIVENKNEKLTPQFILDIHKSITNETLKNKGYEGAFRKNDNVKIVEDITNEVFYIPPEHILIDPLIKKLCDFANHVNDKQFIHPITRGIILHFLIGYIHPFADGNGRTARAIFYWYLISKNYWLIEYLSISNSILKARSQYARAFLHTEYDDNDLTYFIKYNIKSIDAALKSLKEYVKRKAEEKKQVFSLIKADGLNERQALIIKELADNKNKILTVKQIETKFSISNQTARTDLYNLVEKNFLVSRVVNKKMLFFVSEKFNDLVKKRLISN